MPEQTMNPEESLAIDQRKADAGQLKNFCDQLRESIKRTEVEARYIKTLPEMKRPDAYEGQHSEMIAQSMLAVRALEEARMRLGKVLQYAGNGVSIYDKA